MTHHILYYITQYIFILRESLMCTPDTCISLLQISTHYYHYRFHCAVHFAFARVQSCRLLACSFLTSGLRSLFYLPNISSPFLHQHLAAVQALAVAIGHCLASRLFPLVLISIYPHLVVSMD